MITMQDVAKAVGVSQATVSLALNKRKVKNGDIPQETRQRIIDAAKKLGYNRNELATSIKNGRSNTLAYIVCRGIKPYSMAMLAGANALAQSEGFSLRLSILDKTLNFEDCLQRCLGQMVAGIICDNASKTDLERLKAIAGSSHTPIILADNNILHDWCASVTSDEIAGAKLAVARLLAANCERIALFAFASPVLKHPQEPYNALRSDGYRTAVELLGKSSLELQWDGKADSMKSFLRTKRPDGIFCVNDYMACRVLQIAQGIGLEASRDFSIIGYGNLDFCELSAPPLTSVAQPFEEIGSTAVKTLLAAIKGRKSIAGEHVVLPVNLVERSSCAQAHDHIKTE